MDLTALTVTFGAIFLVELPDKTFVAALVLATRYRPWAVWIGVGAAFLVQTLLAVTVGQVVTYLPKTVVQAVAVLIFLAGAVLLVRSAPGAEAEEAEAEQEYAAKARATTSAMASVVASFLVLFAAEWGDLSQLLTISLVGRYHQPVSVFLGAWSALLVVSGLAVVAGRLLLRHIRLSLIHYIGAAVCLSLAGLTLFELAS